MDHLLDSIQRETLMLLIKKKRETLMLLTFQLSKDVYVGEMGILIILMKCLFLSKLSLMKI